MHDLALWKARNEAAIHAAFTEAATAPAGFLQEARSELDRLLETGASFPEAKSVLERLFSGLQEDLRVSQ